MLSSEGSLKQQNPGNIPFKTKVLREAINKKNSECMLFSLNPILQGPPLPATN